MKITRIEQFSQKADPPGQHRPDEGLVGWGETTLEGRPESNLRRRRRDGRISTARIRCAEHHWQHIYRSSFFPRWPVVMSALSGIDQALWDIAGKSYGVPTGPPGWRGARPASASMPTGASLTTSDEGLMR